jgi:lysylphosphatidylglycerol synthetase-like protein (DUF2156 family)
MKKLLIVLAIIVSMTLSLGAVANAAATDAAKNAVCESVSRAQGSCASGGADVSNVLKVVLQILSWVAGVVAIFMIVIAGLKYITAAGDSGSVSSAKNTLIYALVGLVIVALAQVVVRFILGQATK